MFGAIASVSALLLSVALLLMGNGLQTTLLPVRGHALERLFFHTGVIHLGTIGFTLRRISKLAPRVEERRTPFADSALIAQTVAPIDTLSEADGAAREETAAHAER